MQTTMRLIGAALFAAALPGSGHAADPAAAAPADQAAIRGVIQHQIDAFRRGDGAAAFAFASPSIQAQFGDSATFMDMVKRGYPSVYRPRDLAFGALVMQDGKLVQRVEITGQDGLGHEALYFMEHEKDGAWRINGCVLTDSGSVGA